MLELVTGTRVDLARSPARLGVGVFETVRVEAGRPRWLSLHLERLAEGCAFLGLEAPPALPSLELPGRGVLRFLAAGRELLVWAEPIESVSGPVRIGLAERPRVPGPLTRFKTLSRLENTLMGREAAARGLDEVIAPATGGHLGDGANSTLLALLDGRLLTPPVADGALPGIARRVLLEAGAAREASLAWEELRGAQALALCSALRGLRPVAWAEGLGAFDPAHPGLAEASALLGPVRG
jgi:branched-chain amino acid aminotransferase